VRGKAKEQLSGRRIWGLEGIGVREGEVGRRKVRGSESVVRIFEKEERDR
jgi:hypothetical protein